MMVWTTVGALTLVMLTPSEEESIALEVDAIDDETAAASASFPMIIRAVIATLAPLTLSKTSEALV